MNKTAVSMLRHYSRIALRTFRKGGAQTFINVIGLSIGLAVCLLILLFVQSELGYEAHLEQGDSLYRLSVLEQDESGATTVERAHLSPAVAPVLAANYPQVTGFARLTPVGPSLTYEDNTFYPEHTYWGDASTLDLLELDLIYGEGTLDTPLSVVISESTALTLAGRADLVGESVTIADELFTVTGVFQDTPEKTHIHVDVLGPVSILTHWFGAEPDELWSSPNYATYVRLAPNTEPRSLEVMWTGFFDNFGGRGAPENATLRLQPATDIHLHSSAVSEFEPQGSIRTVNLMSLIAVIVLLIACANYINLATARALRRAREVGLRKVVGATRTQLAGQFLGEAVAVTMLSLAIGAVAAELAAPHFGNFVGKSLSLTSPGATAIIPYLLLAGVVIGLIAGSYPALVLSSFRPAAIFKQRGTSGSGSLFRSILVTGQFALAIALVISTLVVFRQLRFAQTKDPGFDTEQIMLLPGMRSIATDFEPFRERLLAHPDVIDVSHAWRAPLQPLPFSSDLQAEVDGALKEIQIFSMFADEHYFSTFGIETVAGRVFDPSRSSDSEGIFVLNETAVRRLGFSSPEDAVDAPITYAGRPGTVIGVVKDYHQESFHTPIAPMIIWQYPQNYRVVAVKFQSSDIPALADFLSSSWQEVEGDVPISVNFLDDRFEAVYEQEQRLAKAFGAFAGLGIFVACLGLFGIAAATMERRVREIGVRKVFGASTNNLVVRMSSEFLRLVVFAFVLGAPVAWFVMQRWLEEFAYHDGVGLTPVVTSLVLAVVVASLAVIKETWSAARARPVESLRYE